MEKLENQNIEIKLLLEAIFLKYGYDFRNYSDASVKRRVLNYFVKSGLNNLSELLHKVLCDEHFFNGLLLDLSINVTEMFRDP
ncbi:protein-glutamate O-methyltransferase CheR, partial [bacterium]|nr:protein-glutamate O-methyltransferase CheR [bacterium]